jgi:hypothetical protein
MPELTDLIPWENVDWDNMSEEWNSGGGAIVSRPYFYRILSSNKGKKLLIISAVRSQKLANGYHAVDFLRLNEDGFNKLIQVGRNIWH